MPTYRDQGLVLRAIKLGEADRIITILTSRHGKIRAVARGVRRTRSRFGSRLEPFMRDDLLIAQGRKELDTVSQAVVISAYAPKIVADYEAYLSASVIVEAVDKVVSDLREGSESTHRQYLLAVGALAALAAGKRPPALVENSFLLRSVSLAGWTPRLDSCLVCGRQTDLTYFSVESGGVMCKDDHVPGSRRLSPQALFQLRALLMGDWKALEAQTSPEGRLAAEVGEIVEEWSQYYLERPLRATHLLH